MSLKASVNAGLALVGLILFVALAFLFASPASAQEGGGNTPQPQLPVTIISNAPFPLLIDELPTEEQPAFVPLGVKVCSGGQLHYTGLTERWVFQGWSHGPLEECVTLAEPGVYRAIYIHEVVVQVRSTFREVQQSSWVRSGTPVEVEVPATVAEGERIRHRFLRWSEGESPFSPTNVIAPLEPTSLDLEWVKEYQLKVEGPAGAQIQGSGWYPEGAKLVLQAPSFVEAEKQGERLRFAAWESVGLPVLNISNPHDRTIDITVDTAYTIKATYESQASKEYQVVLTGPAGIPLRGSGVYPDGTVLAIKAPDVFERGIAGARLKFAGWENAGQPIVVIASPELPTTTIIVDAPYKVAATYNNQFLVVASTPSGTLTREWVNEGEPLLLEVSAVLEIIPGEQRMVFQRWEGQAGLVSPKISGVVNGPLDLSAIYKRQVMVTVEAPHGSAGGGWHSQGATVIVTVPEEVSERYLFNNTFVRFAGYRPGQSSVQVLAQEPINISAIYETRLDLLVLGVLILGVAVAVPVQLAVIYFVGRWLISLRRRRSQRPPLQRRLPGRRGRSEASS